MHVDIDPILTGFFGCTFIMFYHPLPIMAPPPKILNAILILRPGMVLRACWLKDGIPAGKIGLENGKKMCLIL